MVPAVSGADTFCVGLCRQPVSPWPLVGRAPRGAGFVRLPLRSAERLQSPKRRQRGSACFTIPSTEAATAPATQPATAGEPFPNPPPAGASGPRSPDATGYPAWTPCP
jgi:hypothetical protein